MGDVSKHFSRSEFACSCNCGFDAVDIDLLNLLEDVRGHFKKPVITHCACRCLEHNRKVDSDDTSQHIRGKACDFHIVDTDPEKIATYINEQIQDKGGIGIYTWGCHVDIRADRARWDNRNNDV